MRFIAFIVCLLNFSLLHAEIVEIVSDMYTEEILCETCFGKVREAYALRIADQKYKIPVSTDHEAVKRYLIFNLCCSVPELEQCPSEKKVLFMMEPIRVPLDKSQMYSRIYTWDDEMIDNEKYFKFYFPDLMPMQPNLHAYEEKNLCTMIVRNWNAKHRWAVVDFFAGKPRGDFEFYGSPFPRLSYSKCYKGRIPGLNCGDEKIKILQKYRFCFCIENTVDLRGYITEKIFPCFAAGCVPIYWGAPNVEEYIPKGCYIDYRDFNDLEELYAYMKTMPEGEHNNYLENIRAFLCSSQAQLFTPKNFAETLYEAVVQ